ncbi:MAG: helix-turn-helix domain-containing protein, partial [Gammaproteobacteria bacterium]
LVFDTGQVLVTRAGVPLKLSPTGLKILEVLLRRSPNIVTRDELSFQLWGEHPPDSETSLRVHIHGLRSVIDKPFAVALLHTTPGVGYRLALEHAT